jgi:DNA-binding XRE family transcriptional regulator
MNDCLTQPAPSSSAPVMLHGIDFSVPAVPPSSPPADAPPGTNALLATMLKGWIQLDGETLRRLRLSRYMSQQDLANDCWHRDIRVSIATIKRAECGHPVRFRIARELARCFGVPVEQLLRLSA